MPSISLCNSIKRRFPKLKELMMEIFHFPFRMSKVSCTARNFTLHPSSLIEIFELLFSIVLSIVSKRKVLYLLQSVSKVNYYFKLCKIYRTMELLEALNWRYATKKMNGQAVPQDKVDKILQAAHLAPTSSGL